MTKNLLALANVFLFCSSNQAAQSNGRRPVEDVRQNKGLVMSPLDRNSS